MPALARKLPELPRKASYQDVLDAPDNMVAQIIDGELVLHARPADPHTWTHGELFARIKLRFGEIAEGDGDGLGEWTIQSEPELRLGEDVLVPDVAGWRVENLLRNKAIRFTDVAPDWVCEALSPSTREYDLGRKSDIYAREGVTHLWIVDTDARTLQASILSAGIWLTVATLTDADTVSIPPFEKLNIPLSTFLPGGPSWPLYG